MRICDLSSDVCSSYLGLRGYSAAAVRPPGTIQREGRPLYNKYVMELRYPISVASSVNIFVLAFAEGGNTWSDFSHFNPFNVKRSAGVGVRIFLPIFGLLGLDRKSTRLNSSH